MGNGNLEQMLIAGGAILVGILFSNAMDKRRAKRKAEREAEAFRKYQEKQQKKLQK